MNEQTLLLRFASLLHRFASELEAEANGALSTGPTLSEKRSHAGRIGGQASGRVRRNEAKREAKREAKFEAKSGVTHPPSPLGEEGGGVCDIPKAKQNTPFASFASDALNEARASHPTSALRGGTVHAPAVRSGEGPTDFSDTVQPGEQLTRLAAEARRGLKKPSLRVVPEDDDLDPLSMRPLSESLGELFDVIEERDPGPEGGSA